MIERRMLVSALTGAWGLAMGRRNALAYFDTTQQGFWNSFFAAVVALPAFAILVAAGLESAPIGPHPIRYIAIQSIAYVMGWTAFPLAMAYICDAIGRGNRFIRYIVAYNWATVIQTAILVAALGLSRLPGIPEAAGGFLMLSAIGAAAIYQWFVARVALEITPLAAIAVLLVDAVISGFITLVASALLFAPNAV